jgi:hypothetical protein
MNRGRNAIRKVEIIDLQETLGRRKPYPPLTTVSLFTSFSPAEEDPGRVLSFRIEIRNS